MGHIQLGRLPRTRRWQEVVACSGPAPRNAKSCSRHAGSLEERLRKRRARPHPCSFVLAPDAITALCERRISLENSERRCSCAATERATTSTIRIPT
jgi:hypothetical protein